MEELIKTLTDKVGISEDQAHQALEAIKDFIKEKFPMMAGAVDNLFPADPSAAATSGTQEQSGNIMDKISEMIPGEAGQNIEDTAKNALGKLEGLFGGESK